MINHEDAELERIKNHNLNPTDPAERTVAVRMKEGHMISGLRVSAGSVFKVTPKEYRAQSRLFELLAETDEAAINAKPLGLEHDTFFAERKSNPDRL